MMILATRKKITFTFSILLIIVLVIGAGYYYFGIYQQARYVEVASQAYEEIRTTSQMLKPLELRNSEDYEGAIESLDKAQQFFSRERERLVHADPPLFGLGKQIHQDLLAVIKIYADSIDSAKQKAEFMQKGVKLRDVLNVYTPPNNQKNIKMQDAQNFWESQIPKTKQIGDDLFAEEPPKLNKVSFLELKTAWQQAKSGLDARLKFIIAQDPNSQVDEPLKNPLNNTEIEAIAQLDNFSKLLRDLLDYNTANSYITYYHLFSQSRGEIDARLDQIDTELIKLKNR